MSGRKNPKPLKKYEERYREQRALVWVGFDKQLTHLQDEYSVTVTELAEGLGVSRQKFYDFRADPEKGLSIDRTSLIILWEWLTDPDILNDKKISVDTRKKRAQLRQEGPNSLLQAAGFLLLPNDVESKNSPKSLPKFDSSLKRVEARLTSPWIENGICRAQIVNSILDLVKTQGRSDTILYTQSIGALDALDWLKGSPLYVTDDIVINEYQKKIRSLARSGKNQFFGVELFELYQNILEYHSIDSYSGARVDIVDCQFSILSAPLPASVQDKFKTFSLIYQEAEKELLKLLCDIKELSASGLDTELNANVLFTPVVRALIKSEVGGAKKSIVWRYSSTGTHFENMLSAIRGGLGHSLDITGFSVQATGSNARSLARVSIGLAERDEAGNISRVYQGWWVDSNAITAILVATVIATKDWLYSHGANLSQYFFICHQLGDIDNRLYHIRENVQEYFFRAASGYFHDSNYVDDDSVFDAIKSQISGIEQTLFSEQQTRHYYQTHRQAVKNRLVKTNLAQMRLALKNSEIKKATQNLEAAKSFITTYENADLLEANDSSEEDAYRHILFLHASECLMLHSFYSGDREFLNGKLWRYRPRFGLKSGFKKIGKYLKTVGSLNFDTFSCASQLSGVIGLLELYMAEEKDIVYLRKAAQHLLWAAHYSQRIGYVRRATYWLTHASRVYCRLGDLEKSERISQIAQVTADAVHQSHQEESEYDSKFKALIAAIRYLAEGERLLVKGEFELAIASFLEALKKFVDIHSMDRLTADALYGLYRASHDIEEGIVGDAFQELGVDENDVEPQQDMTAVRHGIIRTLKSIDRHSSWGMVSATFKDLAKSIWHYWAEVGDEISETHPIEEAIDRERFLTAISPA